MQLGWSTGLELGEPGMDANHREFIEVLRSLAYAHDDDVAARLQDFRAHAERHFAEEDALMASSGYDSAKCHVDEHRAVLASVAEVQACVGRGDLQVARRLADELERWFPEHTKVMDAGLTAWLQKRRLGGARIRIERRRQPD